MMRYLSGLIRVACFFALCGILTISSTLLAVESVSTRVLQQGDPIGAFRVTKIAGTTEDGVEPGDDLCYRCRYGSSPMVMVFARKTGSKAIELVRQLDAAIEQNEEHHLRALFTFIGDDAVACVEMASRFATEASVDRVPIVVADDIQYGPINYRIPGDADITIVIASDSQVFKTQVYSESSINVARVMTGVSQMLK